MIFRVSSVEAFRAYEADEAMELADLLPRLLWSGSMQSPAMAAGTAFHKLLEDSPTGIALDEAEAMGHRFVFGADLDVELHPVRELRASKTYVVDGEPIVISGQVDAIDGNLIVDHKTTARFDPERYLAGCQWKMYLDIFGAMRFRWNVFELRPLVDEDMPTYEVMAAHRLEQFAYQGMEEDTQRLVERFARFVREYVEVPA